MTGRMVISQPFLLSRDPQGQAAGWGCYRADGNEIHVGKIR